jgi:hypothetical protein
MLTQHTPSERRSTISWLSLPRTAVLATALLLSACATAQVPAPTTVAANDACRVETVRELRQTGPAGKSAPMFVKRQVQVCEPAAANAKTPIRTL